MQYFSGIILLGIATDTHTPLYDLKVKPPLLVPVHYSRVLLTGIIFCFEQRWVVCGQNDWLWCKAWGFLRQQKLFSFVYCRIKKLKNYYKLLGDYGHHPISVKISTRIHLPRVGVAETSFSFVPLRLPVIWDLALLTLVWKKGVKRYKEAEKPFSQCAFFLQLILYFGLFPFLSLELNVVY